MTICETPEDYRKILEYEKLALKAQIRKEIEGLPIYFDYNHEGDILQFNKKMLKAWEDETGGLLLYRDDVLSIPSLKETE